MTNKLILTIVLASLGLAIYSLMSNLQKVQTEINYYHTDSEINSSSSIYLLQTLNHNNSTKRNNIKTITETPDDRFSSSSLLIPDLKDNLNTSKSSNSVYSNSGTSNNVNSVNFANNKDKNKLKNTSSSGAYVLASKSSGSKSESNLLASAFMSSTSTSGSGNNNNPSLAPSGTNETNGTNNGGDPGGDPTGNPLPLGNDVYILIGIASIYFFTKIFSQKKRIKFTSVKNIIPRLTFLRIAISIGK